MPKRKPKRDPGAVMKAIGRGAKQFPQLRVGQLLCNAVYAKRGSFDLFNIEDGALVDAVDDLIKTYRVVEKLGGNSNG